MQKMRNYKFRLYPNSGQQYKLENNLNVCKWVYNKLIEHVQKSFISRNDMNYILTELKQQESWLYHYHNKMLQMISTQLEGAQKALIQPSKNGRKTGNVRFTRYGKYHTFTYNQPGFKLADNKLSLPKIGDIRIKKYRSMQGNIMTLPENFGWGR
jgi:putative transposase